MPKVRAPRPPALAGSSGQTRLRLERPSPPGRSVSPSIAPTPLGPSALQRRILASPTSPRAIAPALAAAPGSPASTASTAPLWSGLEARPPIQRLRERRYGRQRPKVVIRRHKDRIDPGALRRRLREHTLTDRARAHLRRRPEKTFKTPSGLKFAPDDPTHGHRLQHLFFHARDEPQRRGPHTFFVDPANSRRPDPDPVGRVSQIFRQVQAATNKGRQEPAQGSGIVRTAQGQGRERFDVTPVVKPPLAPVVTGRVGGNVRGQKRGLKTFGYRLVVDQKNRFVTAFPQ